MDDNYGVSFSLKYCRELGVDYKKTYLAILKDLGVKRLRLMSYWDLHQPSQEEYDFSDLDWQFKQAERYGASVSLAIGLRQPRWPECHRPAWTRDLSDDEFRRELLKFIEAAVNRYKDSPALTSWQLENEALNRSFGQCADFSRRRLRDEYKLVKSLDKKHPVIMTLSNSWGIPLRRPRPDLFGVSLYRIQHHGQYSFSKLPVWFYKFRAAAVRLLARRPVFIHELQTEPWGPMPVHKMPAVEQAVSMDEQRFWQHIELAKATGLHPIYLWGAEWWYWLKLQDKNEFWQNAKKLFPCSTLKL